MISFVKIMALMTPEIQRRPKAFKIFLAGKATKFGNQNQCLPPIRPIQSKFENQF